MNSRAKTAKKILADYYRTKGEPQDSLDTGIIDLMTDLLHLADCKGLNGFQLFRTAQAHFLQEKNPT